MKRSIELILQERFGDPIGSYAGDAPAGVRSVEEDCGCTHLDEAKPCDECGFMEVDSGCGCTHVDESKKKLGLWVNGRRTQVKKVIQKLSS